MLDNSDLFFYKMLVSSYCYLSFKQLTFMSVMTFIGFHQASRVDIPPLVYHLQDELKPLLKMPEKNHLALIGTLCR